MGTKFLNTGSHTKRVGWVAKLGAHETSVRTRSQQDFSLSHSSPPIICMRQTREQNSGVVRATDESTEQQMQQR